MANYVLKKFTVDENADTMVDIEGRNAGLFSWFLNLVGIDSSFYLKCHKEYIEYRKASIFGAESLIIPLSAVTGLITGLKKPVQWLYASIIWLFLGLATALGLATESVSAAAFAFLFGMFAAGVCIVFYKIKKEMSLGVQNGGDKPYGLSFQKSLIEGVNVDTQKVQLAIEVMNRAILAKSK